jgi:alpha-glucosidase (family GH31 glycosyl hydrolase)
MGKYGSRWLGDNWADDYYMKVSVSGIMLSNMFGIPLSGADICGFLNDTTEDLCTKWHFVGAFYPFSRNHNGATLAQEPYVWNDTAQGHMRDAIKIKYSLIRYYYTNLFDIRIKGKGTLYKPMFFEFPEDILATNDIEGNVMLGSALKLSINSWDLSLSTFKFYFPKGIWCRIAGNTKGENCF